MKRSADVMKSPTVESFSDRHREWLALMLSTLVLAGCATTKAPTAPVVTAPPTTSTAKATSAADHGDPEQRFKDSLQLMKDKKPDEAQKAFEALVKDFPQFSGPQTDLGILYARAKQKDKALVSFNKAVADNPSNATALDWLGILYRENGAYASAEQSYLKALAVQPDNAGVHFNLGILYDAYLKRPRDALVQYREYQRIAGTDKIIVSAWIKEIEPPAPDSPAPTTPSASGSEVLATKPATVTK